MTSKDINKVQNEVKKASEKTLTGAVKYWCQLFKSGKEINEILKDNVCFYLILKFVPFSNVVIYDWRAFCACILQNDSICIYFAYT